ncbi:EamA family transporter [Streptomyces sp. NPDC054932]
MSKAKSPGGAPGYLMVLTACTLFGLVGTESRVLIDHGITEITLTQFRMFFGFLSMGVALAVFRRDLLRVGRREVPGLIGFGLSLALVIYCYSMAIARLPLAVALVLQFSAAAWLTLADAVRRRRRPPLNVPVALALTLGGVVLMVGVSGSELGALDSVGLLFGLATTASYIVYLHCGRQVGKTVPAATSTTYGALVAAVAWTFVQPPWQIASAAWQPSNLVPLVLIGVIGMAIPFALILAALRRTGPERVGMLSTFEIVATSAIAYVWLGQTLSPQQCAGCLLVVVGVAVCSYYSRPEPVAPAGAAREPSHGGAVGGEGESVTPTAVPDVRTAT